MSGPKHYSTKYSDVPVRSTLSFETPTGSKLSFEASSKLCVKLKRAREEAHERAIASLRRGTDSLARRRLEYGEVEHDVPVVPRPESYADTDSFMTSDPAEHIDNLRRLIRMTRDLGPETVRAFYVAPKKRYEFDAAVTERKVIKSEKQRRLQAEEALFGTAAATERRAQKLARRQ